MFCVNCGTNVPEGSKFCSGCGSQIGEVSAPRVERKSVTLVAVSCPVCGGPIKTDSSQCGYCGSVIVIKLNMPRIDAASLKLGVIDQHIKGFRQRVRSDVNDEEAHYGLGIAYFNLGLIDEAIAQIEEAVRLMPENPSIQLQLALLYGEKNEPRATPLDWGASARIALMRVDRALLLRSNMIEAQLFKASLFVDRCYLGQAAFKFSETEHEITMAADCWQNVLALEPDAVRGPVSQFLHRSFEPIGTNETIALPYEIISNAPQFRVKSGLMSRNKQALAVAQQELDKFINGTVENPARLVDAVRYVAFVVGRRTSSAATDVLAVPPTRR